MEKKKTWKDRLAALVPRYIPNRLVAGVMGLLQMMRKTSKAKVEENCIQNRSILEEQENVTEKRRFFAPPSSSRISESGIRFVSEEGIPWHMVAAKLLLLIMLC